MSVLVGVLLGLVCFIGYGVSDYFGALSSRRLGAFQSVVISRAFSLALVVAIFLAFFKIPALTVWNVALSAVTAAFLLLGYLAFYKGFKVGEVSVVSPIANSAVIVTLGLAILFFGVALTGSEIVAVPFIILGTLLASFELKDLKHLRLKKLKKGASYAIAAMLFWGIGSFLLIPLVNSLGWFIPLFLIYIFYFIYSIVYAGATRMKFANIRVGLLAAALTGITATIGFFAYGVGIQLDYTAIVITMLGAAPTLTVLLALAKLKENPGITLKIGIILILAGLVVLSI